MKATHISLDSMIYGTLEEIDPFMAELIELEEEQQVQKLILVASVSFAPRSVLQALGSVFQNVCAEGYPAYRMRQEPEERLRDMAWQLSSYRRYADRKFYKGVEQVDLVESLAQRRCAEIFAHDAVQPQHILVNVQPLSGAMANLAVFQALMKPGDTLMGMDLYQGGHLTHGSRFNLSGQLYQTVSYSVDPRTEKLNYEEIRRLARRYRPKLIVAGFTSYPWAADWRAFRAIADEVGAFLLADIAHTAGSVVAGVYPNPVGIAHVTTLTTNKTFCGPRGAVIMTTEEALSRAIDRAIFPGEQSAPHPNKIAAMAVAFQIAKSKAYQQLQRQILANARALADGLVKRGLRLAYGGTDTHLLVADLKSIDSRTGYLLYGEPAARILDLAGLVVNKNSLPGDTETSLSSGIRLGTSWVTQRGLDEKDMDTLAGLIYEILVNIRPFAYQGVANLLPRGKIEMDILEAVSCAVRKLTAKAGSDRKKRSAAHLDAVDSSGPVSDKLTALRITGWRARQFMQQIGTADLTRLTPGQPMQTFLLNQNGQWIDQVTVLREETTNHGQDRYLIVPSRNKLAQVTAWLHGLSDGYILFDLNDIFRKVEGPVTIETVVMDSSTVSFDPIKRQTFSKYRNLESVPSLSDLYSSHPEAFELTKPYFIGQSYLSPAVSAVKETWCWQAPAHVLRSTPLHAVHKTLGAKMIDFEGWSMPVWYDSALKEHQFVRTTAGLFDITHMGIFRIEGPSAVSFLDVVFSNYVAWLEEGQSCYGYLLNPNGEVIDDAIIYRCSGDRYLMVVNAANEAKDWDWLNKVNERKVAIDQARPWVQVDLPAVLQNLKSVAAGDRQLCSLSLQGPASLAVLQVLAEQPELKIRISRLRRGHLLECRLDQMPLIVSRTGYTGEEWGYELFVHPDQVVGLWQKILEAGKSFGIGPAGLAARDSTRTEAGLPLWGQELAGPESISPIEAGFGAYVKFHKPFFIGREALLAKEQKCVRHLIRFQIEQKGVRRPKTGDAVMDRENKTIGFITSCAVSVDRTYYGMALVEHENHYPLVVFPSNGRSSHANVQPVALNVLLRFPEAGLTRPDIKMPGMTTNG